VDGAVGANDISIGGWHVGFTIGDDQWCFHPGFSTPPGASRLQKRNGNHVFWQNETVGWVPECHVLHPIKIFVNYETLEAHLYLSCANKNVNTFASLDDTDEMETYSEQMYSSKKSKSRPIMKEKMAKKSAFTLPPTKPEVYKKKWMLSKNIFDKFKHNILPFMIKYHTENDKIAPQAVGLFGPLSVYLAIRNTAKDEIEKVQ